MTKLECLLWLTDNGYPVLLWPTRAIHGCVELSRWELTAEVTDRSRSSPDQRQYFIEVGRALSGKAVAWVYEYPRPASLDADVSLALDRASRIPEERSAWIDTPELYQAPFLFSGHRIDDLNDADSIGPELEENDQ